MSVLEDSSSPSKTSCKRLFEDGGFNSHPPSDLKYQKVDGVRSSPDMCGATSSAGVDSASDKNITHSKEEFTRYFPEPNGKYGDNDLGTLTEVVVKSENYLDYSSVRRSKICGKKEWRSSSGETDHDFDLKDVPLYYGKDVKIGVEGDDNDPQIYTSEKQKHLINLMIVDVDEPQGVMVTEALKLFDEHLKEIKEDHEKLEPRGERKTKFAYFEAAKRLKKEGKYVIHEKPFGHIPGVKIGDEFRFRSQLVVVGLHQQLIAGIDHIDIRGKIYATSVVDAGRYENTAKTLDVLIYSGHGGNLKIQDNNVDQKLEKGNLALMNSKKMGYPVRVTYKRKDHGCVVYVYDGLYVVSNAWKESNHVGNLVYKFELHRMPGQPSSLKKYDVESKKAETRLHEVRIVGDVSQEKVKIPVSVINGVDGLEFCMTKGIPKAKEKIPIDDREICMEEDISGGKEKIPIRAMNGVDGDRPPTFAYVTSMVYPSWYRNIDPAGCNCVDGCSDSRRCPCIVKNRGEIPYNENGSIMKTTAKVHECGPLCKCPPTCMNRVSQLGPRYRLEIFKTLNRGWGVRSHDRIPSGGFVCEYIGEFLREQEADLRIGGDEYLFDICKGPGGSGKGFSIDAAVFGNIGRFINHSCSPNMYAQKVIYDHDDHRMPHIMFFATEEIAPLKELSYDYNYRLGTVCDANGNIKTKDCYCASHKCKKRLY